MPLDAQQTTARLPARWTHSDDAAEVGDELRALAVKASIGGGVVTLTVQQALDAADLLMLAGIDGEDDE